MWLLPTREQYDAWSLPSKLTFWGAILSAAGLLITVGTILWSTIRPVETPPAPFVIAGIGAGPPEQDVVNHALYLVNRGAAPATGIDVDLEVLPSTNHIFVQGQRLATLTRDQPQEGSLPPFVHMRLHIPRLVQSEYVAIIFQAPKREWIAIVPALRKTIPGFRFPRIVRATFDGGLISLDDDVVQFRRGGTFADPITNRRLPIAKESTGEVTAGQAASGTHK